MSFNDPIADMLTRIRNGARIGQSVVAMPTSKIKVEIARILKEEGFIESYEIVTDENAVQATLRIRLKYVGERRQRRPVITGLERVSRPGRRVYTHKQDIRGCFRGWVWQLLPSEEGVMTGRRTPAWRWR